MKSTYFKHIILFFGLLLIIDIGSGFFFRKYFYNISFGIYGAINNSLKSDAELLILGSSRAMHHYNPTVLTEELKVTCYNSGIGGQGLFYNYAILNEIIKNNKPKTVILDISPNVIVGRESYSKLNILLPYYKKYSSFKEVISLDKKFSKLQTVSNLNLYNSTFYDFLRNYSKKYKETNNGFVPLNNQLEITNFEPFFLQNENIDDNKTKYLYKIINLCKSNNIKLIGVVSPTYIKYDKNNRIIKTVKTIFYEKEIEFLDYSNFPKLYKNSKYFKDQIHMNGLGADIFSKDLSEKINNNN